MGACCSNEDDACILGRVNNNPLTTLALAFDSTFHPTRPTVTQDYDHNYIGGTKMDFDGSVLPTGPLKMWNWAPEESRHLWSFSRGYFDAPERGGCDMSGSFNKGGFAAKLCYICVHAPDMESASFEHWEAGSVPRAHRGRCMAAVSKKKKK